SEISKQVLKSLFYIKLKSERRPCASTTSRAAFRLKCRGGSDSTVGLYGNGRQTTRARRRSASGVGSRTASAQLAATPETVAETDLRKQRARSHEPVEDQRLRCAADGPGRTLAAEDGSHRGSVEIGVLGEIIDHDLGHGDSPRIGK